MDDIYDLIDKTFSSRHSESCDNPQCSKRLGRDHIDVSYRGVLRSFCSNNCRIEAILIPGMWDKEALVIN